MPEYMHSIYIINNTAWVQKILGLCPCRHQWFPRGPSVSLCERGPSLSHEIILLYIGTEQSQ